jgi:hypothetical protein
MTQGNDMGTVLLYLSPCNIFSKRHGDRYKRTVPLNLDKDIVQLQNTGVLNIFGNR